MPMLGGDNTQFPQIHANTLKLSLLRISFLPKFYDISQLCLLIFLSIYRYREDDAISPDLEEERRGEALKTARLAGPFRTCSACIASRPPSLPISARIGSISPFATISRHVPKNTDWRIPLKEGTFCGIWQFQYDLLIPEVCCKLKAQKLMRVTFADVVSVYA